MNIGVGDVSTNGVVERSAVGRMRSVRLIAVLGALSAFGPVTTDLYLPSLPQTAAALHTSQSGVQSSLTACLIGLAFGQLLVGPISDARGRRGPLLAGMVVFIAASLLCAFAPNVLVFDLFRLLQGLAGAAGIVIAFAVVRDVYEGAEAGKAYSILLAVNGVAPIIAPVVGGQLLRFVEWRGVFLVLAALGVMFLALAYLWVPETLPVDERRGGGIVMMGHDVRQVVRDRSFVGYVLVVGFSFGAMVAYISASSFVFQQVYQASPQLFSLFFAINGAGILVANGVNARLLNRRTPRALLDIGLFGLALGGVAVLVVVVSGLGLWFLVPALFLMVASIGFIQPNATALALEPHAATAGSASAVLGCTQFLFGALVAPLVGLGGISAIPMGVLAVVLCTFAVIVRMTLGRRDIRG
ncbi:multidrug effflux MFS transporter [Nocardia altamirensis]|uniref:multidrug effflux MFS transporter n=1 Tax=Nocardia altamirensis TaxID=472158 RepID=UPI000B124193|nr:multidrug effflux MFS transporter [Nocardia altamirensis]